MNKKHHLKLRGKKPFNIMYHKLSKWKMFMHEKKDFKSIQYLPEFFIFTSAQRIGILL